MRFDQQDYFQREPSDRAERQNRDLLLVYQSLGDDESRFVEGAGLIDALCHAISSWDQVTRYVSQFAGSCVLAQAEPSSMYQFLDRIVDEEIPISLAFLIEPWDSGLAIELMQRGASGAFSRSDSIASIAAQLRRIFERSRQLQSEWDFVLQQRQRLHRLNEKEQVVLRNVLAGLPNKSIAKKLEVSQRTVESRRHEIFRKTETSNLVALAKLVMDAKLTHLINGHGENHFESGQEENLIGSESVEE